MNKISLIISREYSTRVKKKSFLLTTIFVPLIMLAFYIGIIAIAVSDSSGSKEDVKKIAVIDEANIFKDKKETIDAQIKFTFLSNESYSSFSKSYKTKGYDALLYIASFPLDSAGSIILQSPTSFNLSLSSRLKDAINDAIVARRLEAQGITPEKYKSIESDVSVQFLTDTATGSKRNNPEVGYFVSFACGLLIYMMMLIYGSQVMRGVMEEKMNRISEVMSSSVKPFDLMMGKIVGIGAVGLTQFAIWIVIMIVAQASIPLIFSDLFNQMTSAGADSKMNMIADIGSSLSTLPLLRIIICFVFYFLSGYLTYAALFAAIGSAVNDDQQEVQQLVFPVMMPIILGFIIMTKAITDPYSNLVIFGSYFPLTSPIVMMGRIAFDISIWEIMISMVILVFSFILITMLAARIYRVGILMYGKKPSWKELMAWGFKRN